MISPSKFYIFATLKSLVPELSCTQALSAIIMSGFLLQHMFVTSMPITITRMVTLHNSSSFNWDESQKNDILGSFFWGHLLFKVPAGRLSEIYGPRMTLGIAMSLATSVIILTPTLCYLGFYGTLSARLVLGISASFYLPTIPTLIKKWVPTDEGYKLIVQLSVVAVFLLLVLGLYGYLISILEWDGIFYFIGVASGIWTTAWFCFVYNSPEEHPTIRKIEKTQIREALKEKVFFSETRKTPWKDILSSGAVWACILPFCCASFSTSLILSQMPTYINQVLHMDAKITGILINALFLGK